MADLLIREVPEEVVASIDARAKRVGLSRSEYLRRELAAAAKRSAAKVATADLRRFTGAFSDLADPELIQRAWE
ncbi:MAG: type II toxin-antitoxin system VapB family antitoxin [Actinomycetota bacterium]